MAGVDDEPPWRDVPLWQRIAFVTIVLVVILLAAAYRIFVLERGVWTDVFALAGALLGFITVRIVWLKLRRRR